MNIADYIAGALEISVSELIQAAPETPQRKRWKNILAELHAALAEAVAKNNFEPMKRLVHPQVRLRCHWDSPFALNGEYHGYEGTLEYAQRTREFLKNIDMIDRSAVIEYIDGDGDLLFVRGTDSYTFSNNTTSAFWFSHFYRLEDNKIRVFEQFCGSLHTPAK